MAARSLIVTVAAVVAAVAPACGAGDSTTPPAATPSQSTGAPAVTVSASPAGDSAGTLRAEIHAHAARMMADIKAAEERGDVVDGVPVGESDNPYDYVGISPVFVKLVALGEPALPAIAAEIEASKQDGLREYLLAAVGAQISGDTPGGDAQTWSTGKQWARQYRAEQ